MTSLFGTLIGYLLEAESAMAVWLIQHVNVGGSTDYECLPAATDLCYQIVDRFPNTVRGTSSDLRIETSSVSLTRTILLSRPSILLRMWRTVYHALRGILQNLNAGFRHYLIQPESFDLIDSIIYYAKISSPNEWTHDGDVTRDFE
ncbi:hypothetical protein MMC12_005267 [Toensbergia leucococca]|nr:hypothetical protein [Toensbergia leucococca]